MAEDRKRHRRSTPVIVRPPKTAPLSEEDRELAVYAIAHMVAQWWDPDGHETTDNGIGTRDGETPNWLAD